MTNEAYAIPANNYFGNQTEIKDATEQKKGKFKEFGESIDRFLDTDIKINLEVLKRKLEDIKLPTLNIRRQEKTAKRRFDETSAQNFYDKIKGAQEYVFQNMRADGKTVSYMKKNGPQGLELVAFRPIPHKQMYAAEDGSPIRIFDIHAYYK
jgi:hypothetical protein